MHVSAYMCAESTAVGTSTDCKAQVTTGEVNHCLAQELV